MSSADPRVFAVDIGGTSIRMAAVDRAGRITQRTKVDTEPGRGIGVATERIAALFEDVAGDLEVEGGRRPLATGISTAGPLDPRTGTYDHPPNLPGWHGRSMVPGLTEALRLPVAVGHDASLAALAETRYGARRGATDLVYLTVSTGIGAGIVAGGRLVTGSRGGAGEAGHIIVEPGGPSCGAGCPGCLEGVASGTAIAAEAARRVAAGEPSSLGGAPSAADVFAAAGRGDALARAVVDRAITRLGAGIASLLAVLDPEAVILGGGVLQGLEPRWDDLVREVQRQALPRYRERGVPVERSTLGDDASLLGAAVLAFEAAEARQERVKLPPA